jgi:hypothetical protein
MPVDKLLGYTYDKTLLPVIAEAQEAGASENLNLLLEYARSYEKAVTGLVRFYKPDSGSTAP